MPPYQNTRHMQNQNVPFGASRIHNHNYDIEDDNSKIRSDTVSANAPFSPKPISILENLFGGKAPDTERLILVILIILLAKDGADLTLLIALGYLLV